MPEICCPEDERERLQQTISYTFAEKSELRGDIRTQRLIALTILGLALALALAGTALGIRRHHPRGSRYRHRVDAALAQRRDIIPGYPQR